MKQRIEKWIPTTNVLNIKSLKIYYFLVSSYRRLKKDRKDIRKQELLLANMREGQVLQSVLNKEVLLLQGRRKQGGRPDKDR